MKEIRLSPTLALIALAIAWGMTGPLRAQETPKDSPDQGAARAAVLSFVDLLADPDIARAKAAFAGSDEDFGIARNIHAVIHARMKFVAAVLKALPDEKAPPVDDLSIEGLKKRVPRREVTVTGDTAVVGPEWRLKKIDAAWKVTDMAAGAGDKKVATTMFPAFTTVIAEFLPDIEAGKYKSLRELNEAMRPRFQEVMQTLEGKPATRPAQ